MEKVASLRYGVIFKKAFCVPEIFSAFVSDFIGKEIRISKVETEKTFDPPVGRIDSRFDLYAEDEENRIIVDVQHVRHGDHYHRFLHYHCAALLEQAASSRDYSPGLEVFTIVVLTSGERHKKDVCVTDFDPKDMGGNPLGEIPHRIFYVCPKYVTDATPEPYREWLAAIHDTMDEEVDETRYRRAEIRDIFRHIRKDTISPRERAVMKDEYSFQRLFDEKYEKGVEKGIRKGRKEGQEEGRKEEQEKIAVRLLGMGTFSEDEISEVTGLSPDGIRKLGSGKEG